MAISRLGRTAAAGSGLVALAAAVIWFGILEPRRSLPGGPAPSRGPEPDRARETAAAPRAEQPTAAEAVAPPPAPSTAPPPPAAARSGEAPVAPSFDIVRVEPSGESVIAGRAAPGSTVELLRDGKPHARVASDASGLFAFVPPPFPSGSHEVILQSIAPDGTRTQSRESVTVAIAEKKDARPLVALTTPDKPTVVLSAPDAPAAPAPKAGEPLRSAALPDPGKPPPAAPPAPAAGPRTPVRVATVEAEDGGRLFVSGQAAPGATVRLYLNDTLIAPGGAGADGRVSFAIGRGVKPGGYRIRLDDIDPVTGQVRSRAEVEFRVPAPLAVELPPPAQPYVTQAQEPRRPVESVAARAPSPPPPTLPEPVASAPTQGGIPPATPPAAMPAQDPAPTPAAAERTSAVARSSASDGTSATQSQLDAATVLIPEINTAIVSRGDNLWRISKRVYGRGVRYTVIYSANQDQIRSPRLIYPGQVFVLPGDQPAGVQR